MDIVPRMSRAHRRELLRLGRKSGDFATAQRFHIVARLGLGKTSPEVAEELDVACSTVVRTAHAFAERGIDGLYDRRRGNGSPKVNGAFRHRVTQLLTRTPEDFGWCRPTWTRELVCLQMKREGFPEVAVCCVFRSTWAPHPRAPGHAFRRTWAPIGAKRRAPSGPSERSDGGWSVLARLLRLVAEPLLLPS